MKIKLKNIYHGGHGGHGVKRSGIGMKLNILLFCLAAVILNSCLGVSEPTSP